MRRTAVLVIDRVQHPKAVADSRDANQVAVSYSKVGN
jgi:hypothetical protein